MRLYSIAIILTLLGSWMTTSFAQDIASSLYPYIYTDVSTWPCVRLLNATGQIGCHVPNGAGGILYQIESQDEINNFVSKHGGSKQNYAAVIPYNLLTKLVVANIAALDSTKCISGLIVLLRASSMVPEASLSSPDTSCPNCRFGLYANDPDQYVWNPQGQGLIEENLPFPVFGLNPVDTVSKQVFNIVMRGVAFNLKKQYTDYPLQAIDFKLFMWAAIDSETCLRRGWCQVVGGTSVFSSPSRQIAADDGKKSIVLTASLDSRSLFHDLTNGVATSLSGLVALLTVAESLSRAPVSLELLPKHIVYTGFTAEAWGFAGSQRFVQDISAQFQCTNATRASVCPFLNAPCTFPCVRSMDFKRINIDNIDSLIEFNSVSGLNSNYSSYWAHVDDVDLTQSFVADLQKNNLTLPGQNSQNTIQAANQDGNQRKLPPSSAMSFLQKNRNIKTVVLTDFQKELGSYYNSDMDDKVDLDLMSQSICGLADATAKTVFLKAQEGASTIIPAETITANCTLVSSLLDCLASNFSCPMMKNYFNVSSVGRLSHYTSVFSFVNPQPQLLSRFVFTFLGDVTGTRRNNSDLGPSGCSTMQDCISGEYCIRKQCVSTMTAYHDAYGTGLTYNESTGKVSVTDPTKGTWTESTWDTPTMRVFLVTSTKHQVIELVVGVLWTLISIAVVIFGRSFLKKTFKTD
ncbi:hypothetical protein PHYBLDRAFT_164583 [Phycomyces blakesleeanus NRRL 1555(-)]|uniref:Nicastrin n=1 Tax=Phycomyces blakesleeanus (strain ATCC 8743b / DSM 1359 / FGSC 10004 / NBRC 33097 / NRRL 1555) TaxID=763407 RepID=A0A167PCT8_PHYB8|nr:hypothetical protein PHYBLDRAFT_164583 [Phycomyces blakesleeanus NRRL 1555(-)]OAD77687.1 hypothetical protein PHYBLDRAFT_164583 [Phycomyces blakesleeanus NRRL 1555(-)]|eukprot:XP_018295727.1 hypothetical protein PHYBLDRAFT_164583 [Phycomyces blakesleeanus NRRL 1555(-)]